MKKNRQIRKYWLTIRLNDDEYSALNKFFKQTTAANLSEYSRDILLRNPVIIKYRNQSADDFLSVMLLLKDELNFIGKNFNQAVKKLHTLDRIAEMKNWILLNETHKEKFFKKLDEISLKAAQIHELWSQK